MNIVITGHMGGIGLEFATQLRNAGHVIHGYDLLNGYNVVDSHTQDLIIEQLKSSDVFINNVYGESQLELLKKATASWSGFKKLIVNMNSKKVLKDPSLIVSGTQESKYYTEKMNQMVFARQHANTKKTPLIMSVFPGWIDTNAADMSGENPTDRMKVSTLVKTIVPYIEDFSEFYLQEMVIDLS